jgi:ribosomal protein S18 acetylase RimI-like enzyme
MRPSLFGIFSERTVERFASDSARAGYAPPHEAARMARDKLMQWLPEGICTPDHRFFELRDGAEELVGWMWVVHEKTTAFLLDLEVEEAFRRRGHARRALEWLHRTLAEERFERVALHVFPHAVEARRLYESLGYTGAGAELVRSLAVGAQESV